MCGVVVNVQRPAGTPPPKGAAAGRSKPLLLVHKYLLQADYDVGVEELSRTLLLPLEQGDGRREKAVRHPDVRSMQRSDQIFVILHLFVLHVASHSTVRVTCSRAQPWVMKSLVGTMFVRLRHGLGLCVSPPRVMNDWFVCLFLKCCV